MTPFSFREGKSSLHLLDVRCKFFLVCLNSISVLNADFFSCFLCTVLLLFLFKDAGLSLSEAFKGIKYFFLLLFFVLLARAVAIKGDPIFSFYGVSVTRQGILEGALVCFRFFIVMMTGMLFSATTRPSSIKGAAQWFLKPIPLVPERKVATIISLALNFMPLILRHAREISYAQKARCSDLKKNPVKKIIWLVVPLLKKIFQSADNLVLSMEARCYSEDRTDPEFSRSGKEIPFLLSGFALSAVIAFL